MISPAIRFWWVATILESRPCARRSTSSWDQRGFFEDPLLTSTTSIADDIWRRTVEAILVDLSEEATRRFGGHLRRWDDQAGTFIDEGENGLDEADAPGMVWALPLLFVGRYDRDEDDFVGNTFFDHPTKEVDALDEETEIKLGQGRVPFTRVHKRLCGFVFLRTLRTGSRALSLQRGSLLESVLKLGGAGAVEMWQDTRPAAGARPGNR